MAVARRTYKTVAATADGDNTLIAAPGANQQIKVLGFVLNNATTAGLSILKSGASGTEHARLDLALRDAVPYAGDESVPAFECDKGAALVANNATGVDLLGFLVYTVE